ncbi:MAG: radical SAM protein [Nanoarchaeota archaeon]|nr:radical SAM protein [Nanoarchaeota archaeon]
MKYVMKGNPETGKLNLPHLIVAQSYNCDYACIGCNAVGNGESINPRRMLKIVDDWRAYNMGDAIFHLKGGEPLMFEGIWDTVNHAACKGLYLFMTTSGSKVDQEAVKRLQGVYDKTDGQVIVSLDGSREEINALSRQRGSFETARSAIETLVESGVPVAWNYRVHRGNQEDIGDAIRLANELGVEQFNVLYHAQIRNRNGNLEVPDLEVILPQLERARNNRARDMLEWSVVDMIQRLGSGKYDCNGCTAGFRGFAYITPDGNVYSCPNTVSEKHRLGTIDDSFENLFENGKNLREVHKERLVCKGELEAATKDKEYQRKLDEEEELIKEKIAKTETTSEEREPIAVCFNRNY